MTEPRFEELINLYLDNEIGRHELGELKSAIQDNVLRGQKFERACQLHQAARKALAAQGKKPSADEDEGVRPEADPRTTARAGGLSGQRSRGSESSSGRSGHGSLRNKQSQAYRNATIATLAQRQGSKGSASTVDLAKVSLDSGRSSVATNSALTISFFDSPIGMILAAVFTLVGVAALYFMLRFGAPGEDNSNPAPTGDSVLGTPGGPIDQKELARELQRGRGANTTEATHANIYQSAAGQLATNTVQTNYTAAPTSAPDDVTSSPAVPPSADISANATGSIITSPIPQAMMTAPANSRTGTVNSSPLQVTLPAIPGTSGTQDGWVKMSVPPLVAPPMASGNLDQNGNASVPPVNVP